ncbi:MAG: DNA polymerase I, partial [Candidatus Omnitrophica bacterium]|nr:DNA polymerase I [Candidatus Omnitrophota bacterium]
HADSLKGKLKDKVLNGRNSAVLSHELATLQGDVEIDGSLEDIRIQPADKEKLRHIFEELEFKGSFVDATRLVAETTNRIQRGDDAALVSARLESETPREIVKPVDLGEISRDVKGLIREARDAGRVAFWFDFPEDGGNDFFFGANASAGGKVYQLLAGDVEALRPILDSSEIVKSVYDLKNVRRLLFEKGLSLKGDAFVVLLAGYLLLSGQASHEIDALSWTYLKRPMPEEGFSAHAVKALFDLEYLLRKDLVERGAEGLYRDMELPLSQVLFEMEAEGVSIDVPILGRMSQECDLKISGMTKKLYELAGGEFNLNSPKQLGVILFDKLKLPVVKRTKTGYSTDEEVLTRLSPKHELPALILEYRQLAKLKSTYIDALPRLVSSKTGKLHCSFNQTGTETGRLSSNHPNLQNIPIRSEMGREIRKAFIPSEKGRVLLSADYSQIELRILAHLADEPALKKAFALGEDIHRYTAGLIFDVDQKDVTKEMRYGAKRINFGIIYGMSAFGLAKDLGVPNKEAQSFIDRYFLRYPGIKTFMEREIEKARALGYSETLLKRRRYLPDVHSRNPAVRQFAERQAINTPVQGTAADLIKAAMVVVAHEIRREKLLTRMIITVHDELVFDVPEGEIKVASRLVKDAMEKVVQLSVPIEVTVKVGKNWADMEIV